MNDRSLEGFGIFPDDQLLADCKSEVRSGDIVVWHISDNPKGLRHVRRFYTSPGNRVRFERTEDGERKAIVYKREEVVIVGRVFSVERDGRVVKTFPASGVIGGEL
jgi:SOS-response transcriptional repressor LexA